MGFIDKKKYCTTMTVHGAEPTEDCEGYVALGHAIVLQAVYDYKTKLQHYKEVQNRGGCIKVVNVRPTKNGKRTNTYYITTESVRKDMLPLENFFRGDWCHLLSGLDGDALIEKLRKEEGILVFDKDKTKEISSAERRKNE